MSRREFAAWFALYQREPFDDYSRFHRPAALIAHQAGPTAKAMSLDDLFAFLEKREQVEAQEADSRYSEADLATFRALGRVPPKRN